MPDITIKYTEMWFIDIKLYIFEKLKNHPLIIEKIGSKKVYIKSINNLTNIDEFIFINSWIWRTNKFWIRSYSVQIDAYAKTIEEVDSIKEIIINLFNRREYKWIKSILKTDFWNKAPSRKWISRATLDFEFIFKDMKY
jgi:hypothetical protein